MEVFHHPAMVGNIDHKQQLNPICFCKSDGSELYCIFFTRETAVPFKTIFADFLSFLSLWKTICTDAEQLSPSRLLR